MKEIAEQVSKLEVGDVVRQRTYRIDVPYMTVRARNASEGIIECCWFDYQSKLYEYTFGLEDLVLVKK